MKKLFLLLPVWTGVSFAGLITNGSFEAQGVIPGPDFSTVPTGWTYVGQPGDGTGMFLESYSEFGLPANGNPGSGTEALGFGGNGVSGQAVEQTISTVAGTTYDITYSYVIQQGSEVEDYSVQALNGSTPLAVTGAVCAVSPSTACAGDFNNLAWANATVSFTALSGSTTIVFTDTTAAVHPGTGAGTNWALDTVDVNQTSGPATGAPEPSALTLLLGAAALFGAVRFRRTRG